MLSDFVQFLVFRYALEKGKDSEAVQILVEQIKILSSEISKNKEQLDSATYSEEDYKDTSEEFISVVDKLKKNINEQEKELERLKEQYSNVVLEQGKNSEQAQELANNINKLSDEISANNSKLEEATYNADNYKDALKDSTNVSEEQNKANEDLKEGFTVLKGAVSDLASKALQNAIDKFKELMTSGEQALNSIQAQTGMTNAEMSEFKEQMYDLYSQNYGESLEDVANAMASVQESIDETDPENIKEITKNAIAMNDTFGIDVDETVRAVNSLMINLGLTAEEAFDYMAKGAQSGLNITEELGDNLAEYTQIWGQAGFSAEEMFSILQNGLDSGAYSIDKINDFVKEFVVSLSDGRIEESMESFSTETENLFHAWKNGQATQADVFQSVISDLSNMTNQQEALNLASTVWGSLGEDNAMSVITALNNVNNTYSNVQGTMQNINDIKYDDIGNQISSLGRQFEVDIIQPIVEGVTPQLKEIINWVSEHLPEVTAVVVTLTSAVLGYKAAVSISDILKNVKTAITLLTASRTAETAATTSATAAQTGLNTAMNANPILLLITAIASLVLGIGSYALATQSATDDTTKFTQAIEDAKASAQDMISQTQADVEVIRTLGEHYDELRKKTVRSADEQKELDSIAEELAKKLGVTTEAIKDQSGAYKDLSSDIQNATEDMIAQAEAQAAQELLVEAIKAQKGAEEKLNEARQKYKKTV